MVGGTKTLPDGLDELKFVPDVLNQSNPLTLLYGNFEFSLFDN